MHDTLTVVVLGDIRRGVFRDAGAARGTSVAAVWWTRANPNHAVPRARVGRHGASRRVRCSAQTRLVAIRSASLPSIDAILPAEHPQRVEPNSANPIQPFSPSPSHNARRATRRHQLTTLRIQNSGEAPSRFTCI
ncbi:hypothetical protein BC834DRAFT_274256 [Gloeopeniophorella convolvens]|nr:hypothetical protein BC834DRAFT_274256 [Gloeopeniophorella convolvens]